MDSASNLPWNIVAVIAGSAAAIVGALIVLNLRSIKSCLRSFAQRIDRQDTQIEKCEDEVKTLNKNISVCKTDCDRTNVSKEDWVRSEGYTRKELKEVTTILNKLDGKLEVVSKLPEICGSIAREVAIQVKQGG